MHPLRDTWKGMKARCNNPSRRDYPRYGGRGVRVCERWMTSFESFCEDMGPKPSASHSIDRYPDPRGNYEPGNCRWATIQEQAANKRNNVWLTAFGRTQLAADWCREFNLRQCVLYQRLQRGMGIEDALTKPRRYKDVRIRTRGVRATRVHGPLPGQYFLDRYLQRERASYATFGSGIGVSRQLVHMWLVGRCKPSLSLQEQIEVHTQGFIQCSHWQ